MITMRYHSCAAFLMLLCIGCASTPAGPLAGKGLPNFDRVDSHVFRGGQPSGDGFGELVELEVGTIIDLREPGEKLPSEGAEKRAATAAQIEYIPEPMPGLGAPSRDAVKRILSVLSDPGREKPVFIHCRRGSDRTGTVVAIYRITHDCWTADRAIQEAKEKGMFWFELGMRKLIREWYEEIKAQSCEERRQSISRRVAARRLAP